ncbi:MAG: hypothetical protein SFX73_27865 [Kofleriaceae bacterium]|nr:hypothetical protein [Kofleriaceae bacterium]
MDVSLAAEPSSTRRVRELLARVRARLGAQQRDAMERWDLAAAWDGATLAELRADKLDLATLQRLAGKLASHSPSERILDVRVAALPQVMQFAAQRPAAVSALVWTWLGREHASLASHLIHVIRERAGLPGLRRTIGADEPLAVEPSWFADRQLEDAARWLAVLPPPPAATVADTVAASEAQRAAAERIAVGELALFLRRAAAFFVHLSAAGVDPLGFTLGREAQLDVDPPISQRLEIAAWARSVGPVLCVRGQLVVLRIPVVDAPWALALEMIAAELGRGLGGGAGLMLRLRGDGVDVPARRAPLLLCLPGEPVDELGARFERWLAHAYPWAVDAWRPWS